MLNAQCSMMPSFGAGTPSHHERVFIEHFSLSTFHFPLIGAMRVSIPGRDGVVENDK
jgi:hypothetical protein